MNREFRWDIAHDAWVYDGRDRYIDFTSGIFAVNTGHGNVKIETAIRIQLAKGLVHAYTYGTEIREEYERRLCEWTGYEDCALFTTGSEAVEAALRVMRNYRHLGMVHKTVFGRENCFHGKTYGSRRKITWINDPMPPSSRQGNWIVEGYRGWDAHFWPDHFIDYLKRKQHGGQLICFDEVQSGFGRTGKKFAYEWYGIKPDILVVGKGSHSGFPGSAVLVRDKTLLEPWKDEFSSTHGGNPLACAAGLATIDEFERLDLVEEARRKGEILHNELKKFMGREAGIFGKCAVSGRGMVAAVLLPDVTIADNIVLNTRNRGLLLVHTGKNSVKIGPPLTIPDDVLLEGLEILGEVLSEL